MQNEKQYTNGYQLSFLATIFAKVSGYKNLQIDTESLTLNKGHFFETRVAYLDINQHIQIKLGLIWDTLSISTLDGTINFSGVSKKHSQFIQNKLNQSIKRFRATAIEQLVKAISLALLDAKPLINRHHYIRRQVIKNWLDQHGKIMHTISLSIEKLLPPETKSALHTIKPFLIKGFDVVDELNALFVKNTLIHYQQLFDQIETNPLTAKQREACVINEAHNLVLAGAGTGKTSTMVGRVAYLLAADIAQNNEILMLAYGKDAQNEMDNRIKSKLSGAKLNTQTFHALGLQIISQVTGERPSIHEMAIDPKKREQFVHSQFTLLLKIPAYQRLLIQYFSQYLFPYKSPYSFKSLKEYSAYIIENDIRTLQGELVKSYEECEIANFLYRQGVAYRYEAKYQFTTRTIEYKPYQPDFYLTDFDIYIEHFAVNQINETPPFINQEQYLEGMRWKRELHQKHKTKLIETYSYEKQQGQLTDKLDEKLKAAGIQYQPRSPDALLLNLKEETSKFSQLMADLLTLFKATCANFGQLTNKLNSGGESNERANATSSLFKPIYEAYQAELTSTKSIDYDDMINQSITYIESGQYQSPYTHILVDEFQDISIPRAHMIKALLSQKPDSTLFCVGDDWQSIYQFSGSDVSLTKEFSTHFGVTATSILDKTFRFNNKISEAASRFVMQNPSQITKTITTHHQVDHSAITIIMSKQSDFGLAHALNAIKEHAPVNSSVLILARFKHSKPKSFRAIQQQFPTLVIQFMSVHSSKGKEADFVIMLEMISGEFGFPSEKKTNPLLALLLPKSETFPLAEERRLFYVALTRARHHVYLITDATKASPFIKELIKDGYSVITDAITGQDFQDKIADQSCPKCEVGFLVPRDSAKGHFYECSHFPRCDYTQNACQWCAHELIVEGDFKICSNKKCDYKIPLCPECGGDLSIRSGRYGKLWGCQNYASNQEFSCTYTKNYTAES